MTLLPPSTNSEYTGSPAAVYFLALSGVLTILPGMIHSFLPDGGAGVIAGLDLSHNPSLIIGVFAWVGAVQIPHGLAVLLVAVRYRSLVPIFLALTLLERGLMALAGWGWKAPPSGQHPPEHYASLFALPLLVLFLALSLRTPATPAKAVR